MSRYLGFRSQWVAYQHRLRNIDTGAITPLTINYQATYMFLDNRVSINSGWPYTGQNFTWTRLASGNYVVETKYYWYSGYWAESPWVRASFYGNLMGGGGSCLL